MMYHSGTSGNSLANKLACFFLFKRSFKLLFLALTMARKSDKPSSLLTEALAKAIRLTDQFDDTSMMGKAVQKGCSEAFIAKDLNPVRKLQVRRNDKGQAFVKLRTKSKQGLSTLGGEGNEA